MTNSSPSRSLLLLLVLGVLAALAPAASARPRQHRTVRISTHCTVKRTRHSMLKHCVTRRTVSSGQGIPRGAAPVGAPHHGAVAPNPAPAGPSPAGSTAPAPHASPSTAQPAPGQGPAATASVSCADAGLVPDSTNRGRVAAATLCLVNQQRSANGEEPLSSDGALNGAAAAHSADMVQANFFDHTSSNGTGPIARLLASGFVPVGTGYALGENIAWATGSLATPAAIVDGWMHSPEHRANILNGSFNKTGIGVSSSVPAMLSADPGAIYTQDFGVLLG